MKAETRRLIAAVIIAPVLIGLLAGLLGVIAGGWTLATYFFAVISGVAFIFLIGFGLPLHFILKRVGRTGFSLYAAGAAVAGLIIWLLNKEYIGLQVGINWLPFKLVSLPMILVACLLTAAMAWAIARPGLKLPENPK